MEKKHGFWMGLALLLIGVVVGFLISPMKNGISIVGGDAHLKNEPEFDESYDGVPV